MATVDRQEEQTHGGPAQPASGGAARGDGTGPRAASPAEGAPGIPFRGEPDARRDGAPQSLRDASPASLRDDDDPFAIRRRPRASPLRLLGIAIASILVTAVLFRAAVEAVRAFLAG